MITAAIWLLCVAWPTTSSSFIGKCIDQGCAVVAAILLTIAVNA